MGFTENFNYCLEQRGYSAYRFAKIIGVNIQSVVNWKTGATRPHYPKKVQIADHFGITLAELDGDELPALPKQGAEKETAVPKDDGLNYTDFELLQAYHVADARTKEAIRTLLGIKGE
nr:MAG TPA: Helix-turn-helix XRE-family like protein [Bacteriophage sp.]